MRYLYIYIYVNIDTMIHVDKARCSTPCTLYMEPYKALRVRLISMPIGGKLFLQIYVLQISCIALFPKHSPGLVTLFLPLPIYNTSANQCRVKLLIVRILQFNLWKRSLILKNMNKIND